MKNKKSPQLRMLNLGCGSTFHPDWVNIDFTDHGGAVLAYDLRLGIPFSDNTFDVVYHSHVLEHFTRESGELFIKECLRVLKPGGLLRVVVPDLEGIARAYLKAVEEAKDEDKGALARHEWMTIELIDQMTRQESGGEMLRYWQREPIPEKDFMLSRAGFEAENYIKKPRQAPPIKKLGTDAPIAISDLNFLTGGELHRWMYDKISLDRLLRKCGFTCIQNQHYNTSQSPKILSYALDADDEKIRKPDSIFMEAIKCAEGSLSPKIINLSTLDGGGAGIAALRLHKMLQNIVCSHMYVASQKSNTPRLHLFPGAKQKIISTSDGHVSLSEFNNIWKNFKKATSIYKNRPEGVELFSTPLQICDLHNLPFYNDFDVIHLQWIAGMLEPSLSKDALKGKQIVWTLHDMNPFTGGCHYSGGCTRFTENCGSCPQLASNDEKDLSFQTWRNRMVAYRELNLHIVAPSRWLAKEAEKSSLFKRFPVHVIPHAQPLDIFRPLNKDQIRQALSIAPDEFVICFSAQHLTNARKGAEYLIESLKMLAQTPLAKNTRCMLLGDKPPEILFNLGIKANTVGHIDNEEQMAILYNAADAVILPSLEDNSPNVICEAAGCGTPVVAFASGGIPEMIEHKSTGWLAPTKDVESLLQGLTWAYNARYDRNIRLRCRAMALEQWSPTSRAQEYAALFRELSHNPIPNVTQHNSSKNLPKRIKSLLSPDDDAILIEHIDCQQLANKYKQLLQIDVREYFYRLPYIGLYKCLKSGLLQYYPLVTGDERFYIQLQKFDWYYLKDKSEYEHAKKYIKKNDNVLEVGCGEGFFAKLCELQNYTGLEFNSEAIEKCLKKGVNVSSEPIEIYSEKHKNEHDIVCAFQVLEHVSNPYNFIKSCLNCLKDGGKLIISTPSEDAFPGNVPDYILNMPPHHISRWPDIALTNIKDIFNLSAVTLIHDQIMDIHTEFYCHSMSRYHACRKLNISHTLVPDKYQKQVDNLAKIFLPSIQKHLKDNQNKIIGHDVVSIFYK